MSTALYVSFDETDLHLGHIEPMRKVAFDTPNDFTRTFSLRDALVVLRIASGGVVLPWVPDAVHRLFREFHLRRDDLRRGGAAWARASYAIDITAPSFEDVLSADEARDGFQRHIGETWQLLVD